MPVYRTTAYNFRDSKHGADLFALRELGNIYARLMNPTNDVLAKRIAALEGGAAAQTLASGTAAIYFTITNIARAGDEIVAASPCASCPAWTASVSIWYFLSLMLIAPFVP